MNESERVVRDLYRERGWRLFHCGAPDFLVVKGNRIMFIEVKTRSQQLTKNQERWRRALTALGAKYKVERVNDGFRGLLTPSERNEIDKLEEAARKGIRSIFKGEK